MSVLIKGMEMPKSCHECVAGYGGCCFVAPAGADGICPDHGRADFCPLVPVPEHGRLIDADALLNDKGVGTQIAGWGKMYHETAIEYAPTIIQADPAKEGDG